MVQKPESGQDKRKLKGIKTKEKLYKIAERLFFQYNFSDVSVEDITSEAGITKGAFYVHFESKDALIAQLITDYASRADGGYQAFVDSLPDAMSTPEVLLALCGKISDTLSHSIGCENMKKIYLMLPMGTAGTESIKSYDRDLYPLFFGILEKGIQRGELATSLPPENLARHFVMAIRGISYEWCVHYPDFHLHEQTLEHVRLLIDGIRKK